MNQLGTDRTSTGDIIEDNAEAICIVDCSYNVIAWNRQMEVQLKVPKALALGKRIDTLISQFSDDFIYQMEKALDLKGFVSKNSYRFNSSHEEFYLRPSFSPLKDNGEQACMIILRKTDRHSNHLSKFKSLIERSPIATAIYRPDGNSKYFNDAFGKLWGVTAASAEGMSRKHNILEDEQLIELGITPFIQKGFSGENAEIPPVTYYPQQTASIRHLGIKEKYKCVKGHIYPLKDENGLVQEVAVVLLDITFQKQAEQILTDTHLTFQMLTMKLPGVIYEFEEKPDGTSKFRYISQGCEEMFGIAPEEIRKDASLLNHVIHPDDRKSFHKTSKDAQRALKDWQWEGRIIVNGNKKWIEGKSSPTQHENGVVVRYGLLLDITDKKEVEKRYRLSEERLQLALQGAELGLWEWDINDKKKIFNKSWASKMGYTQDELEMDLDVWLQLIHPDDLPLVRKKLNDHISGSTTYFEAEYRYLRKDDSYRWILDRGRAVKHNDSGEVLRVSGTYLDINDKKTSQLLIQKNELLFTQLFENSPLGIVLLNERHCVIQMNQGFKDMFGFSEGEIIGNQLNNILVPRDHKQEAMDINILTANGSVGMLESQRNHKNGTLVPVIIYGVPVIVNNKTIGIYGIYVDITDRTKAENELQIRNNELDNFVYKVSHDLRAPLSSILGLVNLAKIEDNEDDIHQYMALIENRVQQLDSFINDVLSHSKNLKLAILVDIIDFRQIIDDCFIDLNYLPKAGIVKKEIKISREPFYSDKWRINEIFRNLISNAIKYLNPSIDDPFIKITIDITKEQAKIHFEDNGIGIPEATLPKVFEMFYRATEYSEGSGIGLYIVQNAVEKLGGEILITSDLKKGTAFNITIPNRKQAY